MKIKAANTLLWTFFPISAGLVWIPLGASAQSRAAAGQSRAGSSEWRPKDTEWASYAADIKGTRYRPLDQINASNFNKLEVAWRFKTDSIGNRPEYKLEGTPLMVNGIVYAAAGTRRAAIALDAATGELLWVHGEHEGARGAAAPRALSGRGLAYWSDGKEERILYVTPGFRLISLDAKTGALVQPAVAATCCPSCRASIILRFIRASYFLTIRATPLFAGRPERKPV
jgi:glucose dehydrogenase